jgi:hypothetical protein
LTEQSTGGLLLPVIYVFLRLALCGIWFGHRDGLHVLARSSRILLYGLLLNLLPSVALCALGLWTPVADIAVWLSVSLLAAGWSWWRRGCCCPHLVQLQAAVLIMPVLLLSVFMPMRSEWLAGGWDPGLYLTSAVQIARESGTRPFAHNVYREMDQEQRRLLSREENGYHEVMPGLPITIADGELHHYFFPLTPVWGALLYRLGGLGLLVRAATIAAFLAIIPLAALLSLLFGSVWAVLIGLVFLFVSPMWWYHQGVPTSEFLQMCILWGGVVEYLHVRRLRISPWGLGLLAFAFTVNRFSDPPLACVMLFFAGIGEAWFGKRDGFGGMWLSVCAGLTAGILWILVFYPMTIVRLQDKDAALSIVVAASVVVALGGLLIYRLAPSHWLHFMRKPLGLGCGLAGFGTLALSVPAVNARAMLLFEPVPTIFWCLRRYIQLVAYHGVFFWLLAIFGLVVLYLLQPSGKTGRGSLVIVVTGLLAVVALLLLHPGIAPFYPWALRRYIVFLLPVLVFAQCAAVFWALREWGGHWWLRGVKMSILLLAVGALYQGGRVSRNAIRASDYSGMRVFLEQLESVLIPTDIIVADDARWSTPLFLVLGLDVVDGSIIWQKKNADEKHACVDAIMAVGSRVGRRVVWLTSTDAGVDIYGEALGSRRAEKIFDPVVFSYPTVIHSSHATVYANRQNQRTFRFFAWVD